MSRPAAIESPAISAAATEFSTRDWFLRDSRWDDTVWIFAPTSVLEEEHRVELRWDFTLRDGRRFTDPNYATLLESARRLVALTRTRSLSRRLPQRASSVRRYFMHLRILVRWMDQEGFHRFDQLDNAAVMDFSHSAAARTQHSGRRIKPVTLDRHLRLFTYLYRFRAVLGDGLTFEPWPGQGTHAAAGVHRHQRDARAYTPDAVAVPLVQGAIEFLSASAIDILRSRELFARAMVRARERGWRDKACYRAALRALRTVRLRAFGEEIDCRTLSQFRALVDMLYAAAFVVIAYLIGPRVSEILHLQAGCIQPLARCDEPSGSAVPVLTGAIFKLEADYHGRPHKWVAPQPAVHAISVLEALSAPHRLRSGRAELWLRTRDRSRRVTEWERQCTAPLWIPHSGWVNRLLARFAKRLAVPLHHGQPWRLSTHQGRKTFARFVALRDRTSLFALAQHLGHRDRAITDAGYVGTDYALQREIEAEVLEQSVAAWEHMLSTPQLGGRAGAELLAKRPQFRGHSVTQDIKRYARMLVDAGLTLGVCDWGFCVYQQEYSACRGTAFGPNAERREPSTCARCKNFVVSGQHRSYWMDQAQRHEQLLRDPALPTQTLKIARERLTEALSILRSIDAAEPRPP